MGDQLENNQHNLKNLQGSQYRPDSLENTLKNAQNDNDKEILLNEKWNLEVILLVQCQ